MARLHEIGYTIDESAAAFSASLARKSADWDREILLNLSNGMSIGDAMEPLRLVAAARAYVQVCSVSGKLGVCFQQIADYYQIRHDFKKRLLRSFLYPLFLLSTNAAVILFLDHFVRTGLLTLYVEMNMPISASTATIFSSIHFASLLIPYLYLLALAFGLLFLYEKWQVFLTRKLLEILVRLRIPIARLFVNWCWIQGLSILLSGGIDFIQSLRLLAADPLFFTAKSSSMIAQRLEAGFSFLECFTELESLDSQVIPFLQISDKNGDYSGAFSAAAVELRIRLVNQIEQFPKWAEPCCLFVSAFLVAGVYLAMMLPVYDLMSHYA